MLLIEHWESDLDAVIEISPHPIGRGEEIFRLAVVVKVKYPRVFEVTVNYGHDSYMLGNSRQSGSQAAHAANDQVDLHVGRFRKT